MNMSIQYWGLDEDFLLYRDWFFADFFHDFHRFDTFKKLVRCLYGLASTNDSDYDGLRFLSSRRVKNMTMVTIICYCFRDKNHDHLRKSVVKWLQYVQ